MRNLLSMVLKFRFLYAIVSTFSPVAKYDVFHVFTDSTGYWLVTLIFQHTIYTRTKYKKLRQK